MQYQLTSNIADNLCPGLLLEKVATNLKFAPWKVSHKFKGPAISQTLKVFGEPDLRSLADTDGKDLHKQEAITQQQQEKIK